MVLLQTNVGFRKSKSAEGDEGPYMTTGSCDGDDSGLSDPSMIWTSSSLLSANDPVDSASDDPQRTCPYCRKKFTTATWKQKLDRHMLIHTGMKPYQCPHCPHRSNRKDNLRYHVLSVHKQLMSPASQPPL